MFSGFLCCSLPDGPFIQRSCSYAGWARKLGSDRSVADSSVPCRTGIFVCIVDHLGNDLTFSSLYMKIDYRSLDNMFTYRCSILMIGAFTHRLLKIYGVCGIPILDFPHVWGNLFDSHLLRTRSNIAVVIDRSTTVLSIVYRSTHWLTRTSEEPGGVLGTPCHIPVTSGLLNYFYNSHPLSPFVTSLREFH